MAKKVFLVLFALMAILIVVQVFRTVKREAQPLVMSPSDLQKLESSHLTDESVVIITIGDNRYHRAGCEKIYGVTEKITLKAARSKGVHPCRYCIASGSN